MQKQKTKFLKFFVCQSDVCKNQKPSLNHFGFLNVPLTHTIDPNNPKLFFSDSFPMIPISYFCKINCIFGRTFSESMSGYSAVQSKFFSMQFAVLYSTLQYRANFFRCSVLQSSLTSTWQKFAFSCFLHRLIH